MICTICGRDHCAADCPSPMAFRKSGSDPASAGQSTTSTEKTPTAPDITDAEDQSGTDSSSPKLSRRERDRLIRLACLEMVSQWAADGEWSEIVAPVLKELRLHYPTEYWEAFKNSGPSAPHSPGVPQHPP